MKFVAAMLAYRLRRFLFRAEPERMEIQTTAIDFPVLTATEVHQSCHLSRASMEDDCRGTLRLSKAQLNRLDDLAVRIYMNDPDRSKSNDSTETAVQSHGHSQGLMDAASCKKEVNNGR